MSKKKLLFLSLALGLVLNSSGFAIDNNDSVFESKRSYPAQRRPANKIIEDPKSLLLTVMRTGTTHLLILAAVYWLYNLFSPVVNGRSLSSVTNDAAASNTTGVLTNALHRIDPVEYAFTLMDVKDSSCKKHVICELQKAISKRPLIRSLAKFVSISRLSLDGYKDAIEAGDEQQNCDIIFRCQTSKIQ